MALESPKSSLSAVKMTKKSEAEAALVEEVSPESLADQSSEKGEGDQQQASAIDALPGAAASATNTPKRAQNRRKAVKSKKAIKNGVGFTKIRKTNVETGRKNQVLKCLTCHKIFMKLCNVMDHVRTHRGERPYACKFCN